jgi:hypothetical protein
MGTSDTFVRNNKELPMKTVFVSALVFLSALMLHLSCSPRIEDQLAAAIGILTLIMVAVFGWLVNKK